MTSQIRGKSGLLAGFFHVAEAFLLKTLEGVGGSAGLVGAAAENRSTGFFHSSGDGP